MAGMQKGKESASGLGISIGLGVATSGGLMLALSAVLAALIGSGKLSPGSMGYGVLAILIVSAIAGAAFASAMAKSKRMIVSMSCAAGFLLILLSLTALFFGGEYQGIGATSLVVLGGGMVNALLVPPQKRGQHRHTGKRRYG